VRSSSSLTVNAIVFIIASDSSFPSIGRITSSLLLANFTVPVLTWGLDDKA
jgi:hypothetical protein